MIAVIDYGMGNLRSVQKGLEKCGFDVRVTDDPKVAAQADRLVLPGVGAFKDCVDNLLAGGFAEPICRHIEAGRPFLGICLGLQLLFTESEEFGRHPGLNIIPGKVVRFSEDLKADVEDLKVPHMGWNRLIFKKRAPLFDGLKDGSFVYFVHSYYVVPDDPDVVATTTDYGISFCSSIWRDNILACQFHPEKSQEVGLKILKNFGEM
jgi:glutamine amidotransferase